MRTAAERLAGIHEGTTFPRNGVCSLYFPLAPDRIRRKRNAGVAELVDALDLGNGGSANSINGLAVFARALWGGVSRTSEKRPRLTDTKG
jgi:hypothetical protein